MKVPRRQFLHLTAAVAALPFVRNAAWAQAYPSRAVRVIVGFPAEDERAFENTLRTARDAGLTKIHVFPYSPRPGTVTARQDAVPPAAKKERSARLREASHEACLAHWRTKVGREDAVLVDRPGRGYGDDYSPWLVSERAPIGELVGVRGAAASEEGILAA